MKIAIRVDASETIGVGHLARCQNLADRLTDKGCSVVFVSRDFGGEFLDQINSSPYELISLPAPTAADQRLAEANPGSHGQWLATSWQKDAQQTSEALRKHKTLNWLIVDHYGIDHHWHKTVRKMTKKILVIDDLADRQMDCDLFLDQSYFGTDQKRYVTLLPAGCSRFIGPQHMLLGRDFCASPNRVSSQPVNKILVSFGGTDPQSLSTRVVERLHAFLPPEVQIDLAVGGANRRAVELKKYEARENTSVHLGTVSLANLMRSADLGIGCGGITALERAAMRLPSLAIAAADNQLESLQYMERLGLTRLLTSLDDVEKNVKEMLKFGTFQVPKLVMDGTDHIVSSLLSSNSRAIA